MIQAKTGCSKCVGVNIQWFSCNIKLNTLFFFEAIRGKKNKLVLQEGHF